MGSLAALAQLITLNIQSFINEFRTSLKEIKSHLR